MQRWCQHPLIQTPAPTPMEDNTGITRTINFTINDGTDAIKSATVTIDETSKTTGSAGGCSFPNMTDGNYTVIVSADGFETATENITVGEGNTSFTISLSAS